MKLTKQQLLPAIKKAQDDMQDIVRSMPTRAVNARQRKLQKKHGTPRSFAAKVVRAVGEISVLEALVTIRRYRREWDDAKLAAFCGEGKEAQ